MNVLILLLVVTLAGHSHVHGSISGSEDENVIDVDEVSKDSSEQCDPHSPQSESCFKFNPQRYVAHSPLIPCEHVWSDFYECDEPLDLKGNQSARDEVGHGCIKFGGQKFEDVQTTKVNCTILPEIECFGNRTFERTVPCIKYSGHYFVTTLLYSIFLGFLGMDRFSLGHTGTAVGKLLTLGGVGIWWLVDIVLLVTGHLTPEDGSSWMPVA